MFLMAVVVAPASVRDMQLFRRSPIPREVARQVAAGDVVALTGAGASTESGIPDFRSAGGLWERFDPMDYASIHGFRADPERAWRMLVELYALVEGAQPNPAHRALADLEQLGLLRGIVTQNIDSLHQRAGSREVVEFHGHGRELRCLACAWLGPVAERPTAAPRCPRCDAILKPQVVLFGEDIPAQAVRRSAELLATARTLLVVGTAAEVWPAADIPHQLQERGAMIIEFNTTSTHLTGDVAAHSIPGPAGETLPALVKAVRPLLGKR